MTVTELKEKLQKIEHIDDKGNLKVVIDGKHVTAVLIMPTIDGLGEYVELTV